MQQQKSNIRLLGIIIIIFAASHLFLNIYLILSSFTLRPAELQKLIQMLLQVFGPIAVREDMNMAMLFVKVTVGALFLSSGIGIVKLRGWSRKLLFCLLGMRVIYGAVICAAYNIFHAHLFIMILTGLFLFYYFTRSNVKGQFS